MSKVKSVIVRELHKPARKNFLRLRTIVKGLDDMWQADLAEFQAFSKENNGYKYILVVVDSFSKFLWLRPIKSKSGSDVTDAMQNVLNDGRIPKHLCTDMGKEFYNSHFGALMMKHGINHYSTFSVKKAAMAERVIRTIKDRMYKMFSLQGSYKWVRQLPEIESDYNSRKHRTIGMAPKDVTKSKEKYLLSTVFAHPKVQSKAMFKMGDVVRISKYKTVFAKGYLPNWTTELFKIRLIKHGTPVTYMLEDTRGNPIQGRFYEEELQRARYEDAYLVEKVLKKRGDKVLVRWLGFDSSHDSWINKTNVL